MSISIKYIYSACIVASTPDVRILNDPWFTEGAYDGSWWHYPKVEEPIQSIGDVDLIYVSHVHPDHYDPEFLRQYFEACGKKRIIIPNHFPNHLGSKMRADGFEPLVLEEPLVIGSTRIEILPHKTGSTSDIDSAIIIKYYDGRKTHCVVNANDIIFDEEMRQRLKQLAGDIDILLCGYTGAGPYPQTYFDIDDPLLIIEAGKKKNAFFEKYKVNTTALNANVNIPFAGKYILGGKLSHLNQFRGVADPVEVLNFDPKAVILGDGAVIDTLTFAPSSIRREKYSARELNERVAEVSFELMDYERLIPESEVHQLPLKKLLLIAARNAASKSEFELDYFFCIDLPNDEVAIVNARKDCVSPILFSRNRKDLPTPRSELSLDPRYLFGLLTHVYHWNNAEVGSHKKVRRFPNVFVRQAESFLNFLHV